MNRRPARSSLPSMTLLAVLSAVACDGSGDGVPVAGDGSGPNVPDSPLVGRMVLGGPEEIGAYVLDLGSGLTRELLGAVDDPDGRPRRWGPTVPAAGGARHHAILEDCARDAARSLDTDCVVTLDANGDEIGRVETGRIVFGGAHESPDGTMLAFVVYDPGFDTRVLRITDRMGTVLSEGLDAGGERVRGDVSAVRWLPDGDLVHSSLRDDRLVRVSGAPVARPEDDRVILDGRGASLPGGADALGLSDFDVDPTSGEIAFVWNAGTDSDEERDDTLYRIGPDGGEPLPFARVSEVPRLSDPLWSDDGEWIVLNAGNRVDAFAGFGVTGDSVLVALRADSSGERPLTIDDAERVGDGDVVFVRSDCVAGGGCGTGAVDVTEGRRASGWLTGS